MTGVESIQMNSEDEMALWGCVWSLDGRGSLMCFICVWMNRDVVGIYDAMSPRCCGEKSISLRQLIASARKMLTKRNCRLML